MTDRPSRLIFTGTRHDGSNRRILEQHHLKKSGSGDHQARATVKGAWIAAIATILTVVATVLATAQGLSKQLEAAQAAANKSFTREIGTGPYTAYVAVLIDAEILFSRARKDIAVGVPSDRADQLKAEVDAMLIRIKEDKAPVDLVATGELREMADLTINLYGRIGGDINYKLDQRECLAKPLPGSKCETPTVVLPDDSFGDNTVPPGKEADQSFMIHRISCAERAGRVVFTQTAQKLLELGPVPEPVFSDDCYRSWLPERDTWHRVVREADAAKQP